MSGGETAKPGADEQYCESCGSVVKKEAEICPECGVSLGGSPGSGDKDPTIALLLSFLLGGWGGQIYNGQIGKGIGIFVLQIINGILMFFLIGLLTWPIVWLWGCYDAYSVAQKINAGEIEP